LSNLVNRQNSETDTGENLTSVTEVTVKKTQNFQF